MPSLASKFGNRTIKPAEVVEVTHANLEAKTEKKEAPKAIEADKKAYLKSKSSKTVTIRFKNEEFEKLEAQAKAQGISTADLIKTILTQNGAI